jgi:hypothetical protein
VLEQIRRLIVRILCWWDELGQEPIPDHQPPAIRLRDPEARQVALGFHLVLAHGAEQVGPDLENKIRFPWWCARRDSNPQPSDP